MTKTALILGISGMDGSHLADLLLEKDYAVHGIIRRHSVAETQTTRLSHIYDKLTLHYGDLVGDSLARLLHEIQPDEIYHLAAQSHVRVSFDIPIYTADVIALGTLRLLEAIRAAGLTRKTRLYHAGSSEMFGNAPAPQSETTPFQPRSPYACAKVCAHQLVQNYREAYGMFACSGILFNHECVTAETPVIIRRAGIVNVLPIEEVVPHRENPRHGTRYTSEPQELEVWDREDWVKVTCATATWANAREVIRVRGRGALFEATPDHIAFVNEAEARPVGSVSKNDRLTFCSLPVSTPNVTTMTEDEAWLLGALVADGYMGPDGRAKFAKNNDTMRNEVARLWRRVTGGFTTEHDGTSGFCGATTKCIGLHGAGDYARALRAQIYTERGMKRIPVRVLNAAENVQLAFLRGYNTGDGLKAGHGTHEFKSWKTNSQTLAAGLWFLACTVLKQRMILCVEDRDIDNETRSYYTINLNVPGEHAKGAHLRREVTEVVAVDTRNYTGWLFDLATESGTFHAGIGQGWIHNSERRGETFVTRKITRFVGRLAAHNTPVTPQNWKTFFKSPNDYLMLGNLRARRDWGYAPEYTRAMWMMLQQDDPQDFVIGTGESRTVEEFLKVALGKVLSEDWLTTTFPPPFIRYDARLERPAEVDNLRADARKAREILGWRPTVTFHELVTRMVEHDTKLAREERAPSSC